MSLSWTYEPIEPPSLLGYTGAWRAVGANGTTYTLTEHPDPDRRWGLAWSKSEGHCGFTGRGPDREPYRLQAEAIER